jgi:hypothetical protein
MGTTPLAHPFHVEAGPHQIVAQQTGKPPLVQGFTAIAGGALTVPLKPSASPEPGAHLEPPPVVREPPPPPPQPTPTSGPSGEPPPGNWRTPTSWATGVGSVVLGATGIIALVIRGQKSDQLAQKTNTDKTCTMLMGNGFGGADATTCADLANARDTWTGVAIGALATAAVAGVATVVLLVTRPADRKVSSLMPQLAGVPDRRSPLGSRRSEGENIAEERSSARLDPTGR